MLIKIWNILSQNLILKNDELDAGDKGKNKNVSDLWGAASQQWWASTENGQRRQQKDYYGTTDGKVECYTWNDCVPTHSASHEAA